MQMHFKKRQKTLQTLKTIMLVLGVSAGLVACGGNNSIFSYNKNAPNEFDVVTKAPLIIPPDYNLRPPSRDAKGPKQASVNEQAKEILIGVQPTQQQNMSAIERSLLTRANAANSSDEIRKTIERDSGRDSEREAGNPSSDMSESETETDQ